ncbi:hypothetical protein CPB86DRAFT_878741 [Serendipita vermifera]|nr:hypothetical protein CPB86DRAFT_878741 [Serendipita vermifera]
MVKTATNPAIESTVTAQSATERANQTNDPHDIDDAISKWEEVVHSMTDGGTSEDQADIFASYANSLLLRWNLTRQLADIQVMVRSLERSLERLPYSSTKTRYKLLIRLGHVHEDWYQNFKDNSEALTRAIQYWEDAYGLSAILRCMKDAANDILPSLGNACLISFQDEISGIDSIHQAINYYQLALVQARPELETQLRLGLGRVYLELMCYVDEAQNAQLAIECFETIIKKSNEKEELVEASNGKSQAWWWKLISEGIHNIHEQNEDFLFRKWTKNVAVTYPDNGTAVGYYALSFKWMESTSKDELGWYHLAWTLLRFQRQPLPPGFHYFYSHSSYVQYQVEQRKEPKAMFANLPMLLSALEHRSLFASSTNLKEIYMIQRMYYQAWNFSTKTP